MTVYLVPDTFFGRSLQPFQRPYILNLRSTYLSNLNPTITSPFGPLHCRESSCKYTGDWHAHQGQAISRFLLVRDSTSAAIIPITTVSDFDWSDYVETPGVPTAAAERGPAPQTGLNEIPQFSLMTLSDCRPGYESSEYNGLYPSMSDWFAHENGTVATRILTGKVLPSDESSSEQRDEDAEKRISAEILDWLALSEQDWNWTLRRCRLSTVSYTEHGTVTGAHSVAPSTYDQQPFQLVSSVRT